MVSRADQNEVYADFARPGGWNGTLVLSTIIRGGLRFIASSIN